MREDYVREIFDESVQQALNVLHGMKVCQNYLNKIKVEDLSKEMIFPVKTDHIKRNIFAQIGQLLSSSLSLPLSLYHELYPSDNIYQKHKTLSKKYAFMDRDNDTQMLLKAKMFNNKNLQLAKQGIKEYIKFVEYIHKGLIKYQQRKVASLIYLRPDFIKYAHAEVIKIQALRNMKHIANYLK